MTIDLRATTREALRFKLASFEGPLDLLLHLIKRDEIDIYDIPIAHITRQYLETIQAMQLLDLEVAGEFLVMAATLMRVKARLLLPPSPLEAPEESGDPRAELVQRLLEYRKFKEVSLTLREQEERRGRIRTKGYLPRVESNEPLPLKPISLFQLIDAMREALSRRGGETIHEVMLPPVSMEEKMVEIRAALSLGWGQVRFVEVVERCRTRIEVIATFMALLELIRLGEISARQYEEFGEIWLFARERLAAGRAAPDPTGSGPTPEETTGREGATESAVPAGEELEPGTASTEASAEPGEAPFLPEDDEILTPYPEDQP